MAKLMLPLLLFLLFVSCFSAVYMLLLAWPRRRARWMTLHLKDKANRGKVIAMLARLFWLHESSPKARQYEQLLASSGIKLSATSYLVTKRSVLIIGSVLSVLFLMYNDTVTSTLVLLVIAMFLVGLWTVALFDQALLQMLGRRRRMHIMHEVFVLSRQLLYYKGSKMNLHSKLKRCIPFTSVLRHDLDMLIRQWYDGAEQAIHQFKVRLGTDEAYSFAETINAIRLYDDERYYHLLQQRMNDYKEKMELDQESKKETHSYVLFILAGLPIMNTFRVFIYPWVLEGQKLFESLN